jgi:flagellin
MTLQISTNTAAARASYNLGKNNSMLQRSFDRLSSGKKLVSPIQDPGSLAVSMKLSAIGDTSKYLTFASAAIEDTIALDQLSVAVINKALENVAFLRAQNGGVQSRLSFNLQSLAQQKTNMRAALGRIVDADIAEETTQLSKYQVLSQAAASMLSQANANTEIALMLLR